MFLCAKRVCHALKKKYKKDARHSMPGLVWKNGKWETMHPNVTKSVFPKSPKIKILAP